jgi:hypothetical protein
MPGYLIIPKIGAIPKQVRFFFGYLFVCSTLEQISETLTWSRTAGLVFVISGAIE